MRYWTTDLRDDVTGESTVMHGQAQIPVQGHTSALQSGFWNLNDEGGIEAGELFSLFARLRCAIGWFCLTSLLPYLGFLVKRKIRGKLGSRSFG